ncbi:FAD-dependent oxidoreductase [Actinoplanes sp. CA-030573]|uniref:flavin monoamine oxidase family protein n=1 Tax=Actinoplanes sp. CA-030573 TaxID=3239898 RepID=UPI003D8A820F
MSKSARLVASVVSRWGDDPWSRGAWSLIGRHGTPTDRVSLGEPIGGRLRIAGEATHPTRAGMTHGAFEQGVAAARWAADLGHARVAVVGAGVAGLAAARELTGRRVEAIVWEARDRIGGRACGVEVGGFTFDLGANWLQQYEENQLAEVAAALGLTTVATDFTDPLVLGPPAASPAPDPDRIERELRTRLAAAADGASIADVVEEWVRDPAPYPAEAIRRLVDAEIMMDAGKPLSWLSARYGFEPGVGEGDRWIVGSYRPLVQHLASGVEVRLRQPVDRIEVHDDAVRLKSRDATHETDAVIVTTPITVLDTLEFAPPLPAGHRAARSRLGMGRVEKVILRFAEQFWPRHRAGYYRVHGPGTGSVSEWLDATAADGAPTMVGLFAGPWLESVWSGSDIEVADHAVAILSDAVGARPGR